jgi:3-hydroxyacyl-CoA dehydrogenase
MKLLEIIPGNETKPEVVAFMTDFCEEVLGKGVLLCKDVPNFIGNRIGVFDIANAFHITEDKGLKVEETAAIIGKALGRPGTAIFGPWTWWAWTRVST